MIFHKLLYLASFR